MTVSAQERARRDALMSLAEACRRLSDAIATTGAPAGPLASAEADVRRAIATIDPVRSDDPLSGLRDGIDVDDPSRSLPLTR